MRVLTFIFILAIPLGSIAAPGDSSSWRNERVIDKFSGVTRYMANGWSDILYTTPSNSTMENTTNPLMQIGVRCDISKQDEHQFMLTFRIKQVMSSSSDNLIDIGFKVDGHDPIHFKAQRFTNSDHAGYVHLNKKNVANIRKFIAQSKAGVLVVVRVVGSNRGFLETFTVSLLGFTHHTTRALRACAMSIASADISDYDRMQLDSIDRQIKKLMADKQQILQKY
ncbi:hypothetical protein OAP63_00955 [Vibrio sp.]|nr:hypothetical protein [Vibrio sp.]